MQHVPSIQRRPSFNGFPFGLMQRFAAVLLAFAAAGNTALAVHTNLTAKAELSLKETYDSNVYIQDEEPAPANVAAAEAAGLNPVEAKKESFVTSIVPKVGLDYKPCSGFNVSLAYAPEITFYHSASSEDYVAHRGTLNLSGRWEKATWELLNTAAYVDGDDLGPTFARPGDVPAIGGIPLRDRRDAFVFRNGFKFTVPAGDFFVRPVATTYFHDFKTAQLASGTGFVYENYIDRQDINGGLDLGYKVAEKTSVIVGYRFGSQEQFKLLGDNSPYDSTYHRVLVGIEGSPAKWLKLAVLGGPDIRDFSSRAQQTYPGFDDSEMLYWIDASVTLLPTANDSVTLMNRRYEQPAFSSFSVYEDITYDITWKHKFDDHWSASAGFRLYIGDWQAPVQREDWIYTPVVGLTYAHNRHLSAELAYAYDWVENKAGTSTAQTQFAEGREYTRHLVSLGVKYAF